MASGDNIVGKVHRMTTDDNSLYAWTINNFCICCPLPTMMSPEFTTGFNDENVWFLELYNMGNWFDMHNNWFDICLNLKDTTETTEVSVKYELSILNNEKKKALVNTKTGSFRKGNFVACEKFINNADIYNICKLIPNKQLTLLCEIKSTTVRKVQHRDEKLLDDLQNLFEDPKHTDAKIVVGEKTFDVHKAILVSRSSWFKAAFEGGMQEQQKNEVTVRNYDYEVVREVLRFIYTGQIKDVENFVDRLLDAAGFYQLDKLKTICLDILSDNLNLENALQTLHLANTHKAIDLKKRTLEFMSSHINDLVDVDMTCKND